MNIENLDAVICVFCMTVVAQEIDYSKTQYCGQEGSEGNCNEYKGITTIREYIAEYGNDLVTV